MSFLSTLNAEESRILLLVTLLNFLEVVPLLRQGFSGLIIFVISRCVHFVKFILDGADNIIPRFGSNGFYHLLGKLLEAGGVKLALPVQGRENFTFPRIATIIDVTASDTRALCKFLTWKPRFVSLWRRENWPRTVRTYYYSSQFTPGQRSRKTPVRLSPRKPILPLH